MWKVAGVFIRQFNPAPLRGLVTTPCGIAAAFAVAELLVGALGFLIDAAPEVAVADDLFAGR